MTKQFLFILFLGGFFIGSVAQNKCDCKKDIGDFSLINQLLDLKEYKQAATELKKVKTTDIN
ncbi:MAG: hypothetical protein Q8M29_09840 [Bacteroidota bacterium]|nr:hypothetical protein [Bacteroidota bacterium]